VLAGNNQTDCYPPNWEFKKNKTFKKITMNNEIKPVSGVTETGCLANRQIITKADLSGDYTSVEEKGQEIASDLVPECAIGIPTGTSDAIAGAGVRFSTESNQVETCRVSIETICQSDELNIRDHYPRRELELLENKIRYKRETLPPIVLFLIGNIYYVVDGIYRLLAYKRAGYREIEAVVLHGTMRDALLYRFEANSAHGTRLTDSEKHRIAERLLGDAEWRNYTDNLLAYYSGLTDKTIADIRRKKFASSEFPKMRKCIKNGKIITIDTTNIGKRGSINNKNSLTAPDQSFAAEKAKDDPATKTIDFNQPETEFICNEELPPENKTGDAADDPDDPDETEYDPNLAELAQNRKKVQRGEVFVIWSKTSPGRYHLIACADATEPWVYKILFALYRAGLFLTDLPYNRNLKSKIAKGAKPHELHKIANDNLTSKQYRALLRRILINTRQIVEDGSAYFIFYGLHETIPTYFFINRLLGPIRKLVIWYKSGLRQNWSPDFRDGQECAVFGHFGEKMRVWFGTKSQTTVFNERLFSRSIHELPRKVHPCPKPVAVISNFIELALEPGGVVFDALLGSGTTFVAAEVCGRLAVGIELTPAFVAITVERAEKLGLEYTRTTLDRLPEVLAALKPVDYQQENLCSTR